jgi:hypothetical protein
MSKLMKNMHTAKELAQNLLLSGKCTTEAAISHVTFAIETIAEEKEVERKDAFFTDLCFSLFSPFKSLDDEATKICIDDIVREIREMEISWQDRDAIVSALTNRENNSFACKWVLPQFRFNGAGFEIVKTRKCNS